MVEDLPPFEYADLTVADPSYPDKTIDMENASASYSLGATAQGRNPTIASVYGDPKVGEQYLPIARQRAEIAHRLNVNNLEIFSSSLTIPGGDKIVFDRNFSSDKVGIYTLSQNKPGKDYVLNFDASVLDTSKPILSLPEKNFNLRSQFPYTGAGDGLPSIAYSPSGLPVAKCSYMGTTSLNMPYVMKSDNLKNTIIFTGTLYNLNEENYSHDEIYATVGGLYQNCYCYVYTWGNEIIVSSGTAYHTLPLIGDTLSFSAAVSTEVVDVENIDYERINITFKESLYFNGQCLSSDNIRTDDYRRDPSWKDDAQYHAFQGQTREGATVDLCQMVVHNKILEPDIIADISNRHLSKWGF